MSISAELIQSDENCREQIDLPRVQLDQQIIKRMKDCLVVAVVVIAVFIVAVVAVVVVNAVIAVVDVIAVFILAVVVAIAVVNAVLIVAVVGVPPTSRMRMVRDPKLILKLFNFTVSHFKLLVKVP